ncbi:sulfotransferase family 2 domain-containing protein [Sulfurovum sp. NBC37-1]|uniref:sulfotransferase family 2 domain-containing protein n=1 Tax=Sulfurovum sp. (strain NBC37-1) TaxID=387093 RepID=UPI0001587963|nr:sulfotransferase family 2 domain-containing protein [Sulfurovum sp. NBC37-1]BAF72677.1 conserved hypothetical protein [Sulfurovum sp. NBC37-1]
MQLSTKYGFAFLCMPKCASTSIEKTISKYCSINYHKNPLLKHMNARDYHSYVAAFHQKVLPGKKIETFCLVRDPVDWVHSWYRFRMRDPLKNPRHPNHANYTGNITFQEFVTEMIEGSDSRYVRIGTQKDFLMLDNGKIGINNIFPMERMDLVKSFLEDKIGKKIEIPIKNVAQKIDMNLSAELTGKLELFLKEDIELYYNIVSNL